jgi:hypothetical protein
MSRNRYTKLIRKEQHSQFARQEKELVAIGRTLRRQDVESVTVSPRSEAKERRSARLERKHLNKPTRCYAVAADTTQTAPAAVEVAA